MDLTERQRTTNSAVTTIQEHVSRGEFTSAILLSSIYAHMRLRSLVADYLSRNSSGPRWRRIRDFTSVTSFAYLINYARKHEIVGRENLLTLDWIREIRNPVAHESTIWKNPSSTSITRIKAACHFTMQFLLETTD